MTKTTERKADEAILVFKIRVDFQSMTDAQLKLSIRTLRAMLLERQQERASRKYEGAAK